MPRTLVNGVELFHDEVGSGEPVLLHHGYTGSHDVWLKEIASRLSDRYRCIVMDARGAGDSAHPADGYTIEQYALDVIGVADALGLEKFTYVGHSMGGAIGMQLGLEFADRLAKMVLRRMRQRRRSCASRTGRCGRARRGGRRCCGSGSCDRCGSIETRMWRPRWIERCRCPTGTTRIRITRWRRST